MLTHTFMFGRLMCGSDFDNGNGKAFPASWDFRGCRYQWFPANLRARRFAVDVECLETPITLDLIPGGLSTADFLIGWTYAECLSKLFNIPVLLWIRSRPLVVPTLSAVTNSIIEGQVCGTYTGVWKGKDLLYSCAWQIQ